MRAARAFFFLGAATVSETSWRPAGLTIGEAALFASLAFCCIAALRGRPVQLLPASLAAGVCLFAIAGLASSISSASPARLIYEIGRPVWVMLILPWTATMVLRDRRDLLTAILLFGLSGSINGVAAIAGSIGINPLAHTVAGQHRAMGFTHHPNDLGGMAAVTFVPLLALAARMHGGNLLPRPLRWAMVGLVLAALLLSGSVGSLLAVLIALIMWTASPSTRGRLRLVIVLVLAAAVTVSSIAGGSVPSPEKRVVQVLSKPGATGTTGSASARLSMIAGVWPRIREDPFLGVGLNNPNLIIHSEAVDAWYTTGIVGLMGLLLVTGALILIGWRGALSTPTDAGRAIGWSLLCAFVAFTVFAMTEPMFFEEYGWFAGALLVAWATQVARGGWHELPLQGSQVHLFERRSDRPDVEARRQRRTVPA
jgi:hypothetical protein